MNKSENILINLEIERIMKYLKSRDTELTVSECLQEIGSLKLFIERLAKNFVFCKIN